MDWGPNKEGIDWFLNDVWPTLHRKHPDVEFHFAGKGLDPQAHEQLPGAFNHGEVPDARAFCAAHDVLVVPLLRGAGIRVKIVDAMAQGIPVATTNKGAAGLDMENKGCLIHAEKDQFGEALSELLAQPERLEQLRSEGRREVESRFDRKAIAAGLLDFYRQHARP